MATRELNSGNQKVAVKKYAARQRTIRQLASDFNVSYEKMRQVMVKAGYSNGLKVR